MVTLILEPWTPPVRKPKKVITSLAADPALVEAIDRVRGEESRSSFICRATRAVLDALQFADEERVGHHPDEHTA